MRASVKTCPGKHEKGVSLDEWGVKEGFFPVRDVDNETTRVVQPWEIIKFPTDFD